MSHSDIQIISRRPINSTQMVIADFQALLLEHTEITMEMSGNGRQNAESLGFCTAQGAVRWCRLPEIPKCLISGTPSK